jgi:hypothetical protein
MGPARALSRARRAAWTPGPRAAAAAVALGVAALGAYGIAFQARLPRRLPSPANWREVAARLDHEALPGDVVALAPWWSERAREVLPTSLPVLAFPRLAGEELPGVRRVWLLALRDPPGGQGLAGRDLAAVSAAVDGPHAVGGLELTRFDLRSPALPVDSVLDHVPEAEVRSGDRRCVFAGRSGFVCPAGARVAREVREVDLLPRPCLRVTPGKDGAPISILFGGVRMGSVVRGHAAAIGEAALGGEGDVRVVVEVDGRTVAALTVEPGEVGWLPLSTTIAGAAGRALPIRLRLELPSGDARSLCVEVHTLP